MKVTGIKEVTLNISKEEEKRIAAYVIYTTCNLNRNEYVKDGILYRDETHSCGSHSYDETIKVGKATKLQKAGYTILKELE